MSSAATAGAGARVLVVEDEPALRSLIIETLERAGYRAQGVGAAGPAWMALRSGDGPPGLVILDWMLPDTSGIELLGRIRRNPELAGLPVILLTARGEEEERVRGLDAGADDYIVKPFSLEELRARIRAVLRRAAPAPGERLEAGELVLDRVRHEVRAGGEEVRLGPTEYRLLELFMRHPGRVYTRAQLLENAWTRDACVEERTVDVQIRRLRRALEPWGLDRLIETVRGFGYRFSPSRARSDA